MIGGISATAPLATPSLAAPATPALDALVAGAALVHRLYVAGGRRAPPDAMVVLNLLRELQLLLDLAIIETARLSGKAIRSVGEKDASGLVLHRATFRFAPRERAALDRIDACRVHLLRQARAASALPVEPSVYDAAALAAILARAALWHGIVAARLRGERRPDGQPGVTSPSEKRCGA